MHAAPAEYTGHRLPTEPTLVDLRAAVSDYEAICLANIAAVVDRFETHADYPFVDTKLDLQTGRDFPADDPIRGYAAIYGWIQGRGLEALAGHAIWLESYDDPATQALAGRLRAMVRTVLASLRRMCDANDGHLYFFMRPDGTPFALEPGEAVYVPVMAPHFVRNGSEPSLSLSITWRSQWSYDEAGARCFNGLVRKTGYRPAAPGRWPARNRTKSLAFRAWRRVFGSPN